MEKEKWKSIFNILDEIHSDFLLEYPHYNNGKNKKIRSDAERNIRNSIRLADYHIKNNPEVFHVLTGEDNISDYERAIIYNEFMRPNYFGNEMSDLLIKIQNKINSLE